MNSPKTGKRGKGGFRAMVNLREIYVTLICAENFCVVYTIKSKAFLNYYLHDFWLFLV